MFKVEQLFIFIMIFTTLGNLQNSNAEQKVEVDDSSNMILPAETKGKSKAYRRLVDPYPIPPIDIVDTYPKNLEIKFHTDISVLDIGEATDANTNEPLLTVSGKYSFKANIFSSQNTAEPMGGLPGSRIDISPLWTTGKRLAYAGKYWSPKSDKDAVIIVTDTRIVGINVTIEDQPERLRIKKPKYSWE